MVATTPAKIPHGSKPKKPYPDFPLTAHPVGQWSKKINQKVHYFGVWADPQAALNRYLDQRDDLQAGRTPDRGDGLTVKELVNAFLETKKNRVESGELSPLTFRDYVTICMTFADVFGKSRKVEGLHPTDFDHLRNVFAKTHGPDRLTKDVTFVKTLLRFADDTFGVRVRHGSGFKKPARVVLRRTRQQRAPRMFEADELRAILDACSIPLRAMVLLGVNCALGNTDCAKLTFSVLDLNGRWLTYPRAKTSVERRSTLWPETVKAIREAILFRPEPKDPQDDDLVFITKYGHPWGRQKTPDNPVTKEFTKITKELGIHRKGVGFYALRHVLQTIGQRTRDKDAIMLIMGHAPASSDMSVIYSEEGPDDARLRAVADHVRAWLFPRNSRKPR